MSTTFTKLPLSASTNYKGIKIVATATAGTTIHTAGAGAGVNVFDEIWLSFYNSDTTDRTVTLEWGGVTAPDDNIPILVPASSFVQYAIAGLPLQNGLTIGAFVNSGANKVSVFGFVNRSA